MKWSLFAVCVASAVVSGCMPATIVPDGEFVINGAQRAVMEAVVDIIQTEPGSEGLGSTDFFSGFGRDPIRWSVNYDEHFAEDTGHVRASTSYRVCPRAYQCYNEHSFVSVYVEDTGGGRSSVMIQWRRDTRTAYPLADRIYSTLLTTFGHDVR